MPEMNENLNLLDEKTKTGVTIDAEKLDNFPNGTTGITN